MRFCGARAVAGALTASSGPASHSYLPEERVPAINLLIL